MSAAHTRGPWENREGEIIADTRTASCCGQPCVGAEYMGQQEMVCCGNFEADGDAEDVIARVTYECDIPLIVAAPHLLETLKAAALAFRSFQFGNASEEFAQSMAERCLAAIAEATGEQP